MPPCAKPCGRRSSLSTSCWTSTPVPTPPDLFRPQQVGFYYFQRRGAPGPQFRPVRHLLFWPRRRFRQADGDLQDSLRTELDDLPEEEQFAAELLSRSSCPTPHSRNQMGIWTRTSLMKKKFREWFLDHWWDEDEWGSFGDNMADMFGDDWEDTPFLDLLDQCPLETTRSKNTEHTRDTSVCGR